MKPVSTALHLALAAAVLFGSGIKAPWLIIGLVIAAGLLLVGSILRVFLRS